MALPLKEHQADSSQSPHKQDQQVETPEWNSVWMQAVYPTRHRLDFRNSCWGRQKMYRRSLSQTFARRVSSFCCHSVILEVSWVALKLKCRPMTKVERGCSFNSLGTPIHCFKELQHFGWQKVFSPHSAWREVHSEVEVGVGGHLIPKSCSSSNHEWHPKTLCWKWLKMPSRPKLEVLYFKHLRSVIRRGHYLHKLKTFKQSLVLELNCKRTSRCSSACSGCTGSTWSFRRVFIAFSVHRSWISKTSVSGTAKGSYTCYIHWYFSRANMPIPWEIVTSLQPPDLHLLRKRGASSARRSGKARSTLLHGVHSLQVTIQGEEWSDLKFLVLEQRAYNLVRFACSE